MRAFSTLLLGLVLAVVGVVVPPVAVPAAAAPVAAVTNPKVVIIVGATHGATSTYRSYADQVYAEARKYTPNVVKVYSPNATWTAVKNAVNGANVIVYLGHGNGWPSPYTYDPSYTTKDGFGLNATAGNGDSNNKYYGEPSIRTLTPAPNAVVFLFHLCYASGNSEPGHAAPTLSVARQRVDNYAAAFLRTGAKAVIADGHSHSPYYISALFTTRQTIDELWRGAPNFNDNVLTYASTRTPGMTYQLDPDSPTSGYYRAISGRMDLTTEQVTGAAYADTSTDPSTFVIPGAASVTADGGEVWSEPEGPALGTLAVDTLPADTRLRIDGQAGTGPDGSPVFAVTTLDEATSGWMLGSSLVPRDSRAPRTWDVDDGSGRVSPNGDGRGDTWSLDVTLSEDADWTLRVVDGDSTLASASGSGSAAALEWDGLIGGTPAADGTYAWELTATDDWGNAPLVTGGSLVVDTVAPSIESVSLPADATTTFSPNGDGYRDTLAAGVTATEGGSIEATVLAGDDVAATAPAAAANGSGTLAWTGHGDDGLVADGGYTLRLVVEDAAGNQSEPVDRPIAVYTALASVRSNLLIFYPHDRDGYSPYGTFSFNLAAEATVTWRIVNAAGTTVRTIATEQVRAAGTHSFRWDGRTDGGAFVPRGTYRTIVSAASGDLSTSQSASVVVDAFRISVSDTTPARGQSITVTILAAESLSRTPRLTVVQPGQTAWSVSFTHVSGRTYRATVRLRSGSTGTVQFRASGYDLAGGYQWSSLPLPLH